MIPILVGFLFLFLITAYFGYVFAAKVIYPKCFPVKETYEIEKEKGRLIESEYQSWKNEIITIPSDYGYDLYGEYFPIPGSKHTIILSHGITYTRYGSVKYMPIFRALGFNILNYDLRNHGDSGGRNTTFGLYEKQDLVRLVDWALQRGGSDTVVGTMGESMGAAISLQHAAIDNRLAFVIADCSFSDLTEQLAFRLKEDYHLMPFPLLDLASLISQLLSGMHFKQISPIREMQAVKVPILFIHGLEDTFIPPSMVEDLYRAHGHAGSRLVLVPQAKHADAYSTDPRGYTGAVAAFLQDNSIL